MKVHVSLVLLIPQREQSTISYQTLAVHKLLGFCVPCQSYPRTVQRLLSAQNSSSWDPFSEFAQCIEKQLLRSLFRDCSEYRKTVTAFCSQFQNAESKKSTNVQKVTKVMSHCKNGRKSSKYIHYPWVSCWIKLLWL